MSLTFPDGCFAVRFLPSAEARIEAIADFLETETPERAVRPEAVRRLREAVADATAALLTGKRVRRRYPATYENMARPREEWLHVHRYWFGYVRDGGMAAVFTVLDETSEMDRHA